MFATLERIATGIGRLVLVAVIASLQLAAGCGGPSEGCDDIGSYVDTTLEAAPGLIDFSMGQVRLCSFVCSNDTADPAGCVPLAWNCEWTVGVPTVLFVAWAAESCPGQPPIPPGYVLGFADLDDDRALSSGEAYGTAEHGGAPGEDGLDITVLIDGVLP